jgi:hypothetical protein
MNSGRKQLGTAYPSFLTRKTIRSARLSFCRLRENTECAVGAGTQRRLERQAIMCFAGDAVERKVNIRRRFGGHQDNLHAANILEFISFSGGAARRQN